MATRLLLTLLLLIAPVTAHSAAASAPATRPAGEAERVIVQVELMSSAIAALPQRSMPIGTR